VQPSGRKVQALHEAPVPKYEKPLHQFLGLGGYFRRYIAGFAKNTACIALLTKKGVPFHWGREQETARKDLIDKQTCARCLRSQINN
jgi:hypothetical protein